MKNILLVFIFLLLGNVVDAQSLKLKRANKRFDNLAYYSASELYGDLVGTKHESPVMLSNLAMCYYRTNNMAEAVRIFEMFIPKITPSADEIFYYAQALKQVGKTEQGDLQLKRLYQVVNTDLRAKSLIENENYLEEIKARGEQYTLKNLEINTSGADFGGYSYLDQILFLSTRYESISVKREWTWNGSRFLDVFTANESGNELNETGMLNAICTKYHEGPLCSDGGTGLYFTRNNAGKLKVDEKGIRNLSLFFGSKDNTGGISEILLPFCSSEYSVGHPALSPDKKTLYFASDMPGSKGVDIYEVPVLGFGKWGTPKRLEGNVNTDGDEMFPFIAEDGTLYFSSNGHIGLGGLDVFRRKANGEIQNLGQPLNSTNDDFAFVIKANRRNGFVSSNRAGGKGDDDIYSFLFTGHLDITIAGVVTDEKTGEKIANAYVVIKDEKGKQIASVMTDSQGSYSIPALSGMVYTMEVKKEGYTNETASVTTGDENLVKDFQIEESGVEFVYQVKDKSNGSPIEGVAIKINDIKNKSTLNITTASNGSISVVDEKLNLGDKVELEVTLSKSGYLEKTVKVSININSRIINISELMDIYMSRLTVGGDLSELIDINPIYFDLGKSVIRKDAAVELDKIVAVMNEYPKMKIELGSHTDCRSSMASNQKLSAKRAKASADYIKSKITNPSRITGVGYGESKLKVDCPCEGKVVSNCSEEEHQKNRRTEFIIKSVD